jgi:hypothetical protein
MTMKHKVSQLQGKLHQIEKELNSIQDKCTHPSTITRFNKENSIRLFCKECDKELGMPSATQVEEFLNTKK